jgi:hypothetical protein
VSARVIASSAVGLLHRVRLVHASTGAPLRGLAAFLDPPPVGWTVRVLPDTVVVTGRVANPTPSPDPPPRLVVTLTDGAAAELLTLPAAADLPPRSVAVPLDSEVIDVDVHPRRMTLTVVLTGSDGDPRAGRTVAAQGTRGPQPFPTLDLAEQGNGVYRSAAVEWTAALTPAELLVDGAPLRSFAMSFTAPATELHAVVATP